MTLKEILSKRSVVTCAPDSTVTEIANLMTTRNVGSVVIVENEAPLGIITDRDIALRGVADGRDCNRTQARDIMSQPVHTIQVSKTFYEVLSTMRDRECRRVVVIDDANKVLGLISSGDIMESLVQQLGLLAWVTTPHEDKLIPKKKAA